MKTTSHLDRTEECRFRDADPWKSAYITTIQTPGLAIDVKLPIRPVTRCDTWRACPPPNPTGLAAWRLTTWELTPTRFIGHHHPASTREFMLVAPISSVALNCVPVTFLACRVHSDRVRLNPSQFTQIGVHDRLRATPDEEKERLTTPSGGRVSDDIASTLGSRQSGL